MLRLQLDKVPPELVVNQDNGEPYDESTYRHWVSTANVDKLFAPFLSMRRIRRSALERSISASAH
ncbi:hypothetical protein [Bradyrhizobium tunisiense]|jgi:hypothetical protein|uniref:hypothetical protein n=1 Tax=Bradyrhizobium tunisiense TaxID=3278709 RepID=UPI0035D60119